MQALKQVQDHRGTEEAYSAVRGMLKGLGDPFTRFLTPQACLSAVGTVVVVDTPVVVVVVVSLSRWSWCGEMVAVILVDCAAIDRCFLFFMGIVSSLLPDPTLTTRGMALSPLPTNHALDRSMTP